LGDRTQTEGREQVEVPLQQIQTEIWEELGGLRQNFKSPLQAANIVLLSMLRWQLHLEPNVV